LNWRWFNRCISGDVPKVPVFHYDVFTVARNNRAIIRLALDRQSNIGGPARDGPRCVPKIKRVLAMGLFTRDIKTMNDLFVHQLQDIYYAEKRLVKALPKMAEKATDQQLKQGFRAF